jgi:hypothetical protein
LISKIIQQISNQLLFKEKEEYMLSANKFISKNIDLMEFFLKSLLKEPIGGKESKVTATDHQLLLSLYHLHSHFNNNLNAYEKSFEKSSGVHHYKSYEGKDESKKNFQLFLTLNEKLGLPQELSLKSRQKIKSSKKE